MCKVAYLIVTQNKQRWSWLALRTARDQYLQHFGKIGTGDLILLQQEIEQAVEKDKQDREKIQKGEEPSSTSSSLGVTTSSTGAGDERVSSPLILGGTLGGENDGEKITEEGDGKVTKAEVEASALDAQGDVKMES